VLLDKTAERIFSLSPLVMILSLVIHVIGNSSA